MSSSLSPLERYHYELKKQKGVQIFDIDGKVTPEAIAICKEIGIKSDDLLPKTIDQFKSTHSNLQDVAQLSSDHYEKRRKYRIRQVKQFLIKKEKEEESQSSPQTLLLNQQQQFSSCQTSPRNSNQSSRYNKKNNFSPNNHRQEKMKEKRVKEIVENMDYEQKLKLVRRLMKFEKLQHMNLEKEEQEKERMEQLENERELRDKKYEETMKKKEKKRKEEQEKYQKKQEYQKEMEQHLQQLQEEDNNKRYQMHQTFYNEITNKINHDENHQQILSQKNYQLYLQRSNHMKERSIQKQHQRNLWLEQSNSQFNQINNDIQNKNHKKNLQLFDKIRSHSTKNQYMKEIILKNQNNNQEQELLNQSACMERYIAAKIASPRLRDMSQLQKKREEQQQSAQKKREEQDENEMMKRSEIYENLRNKIESADKSRYHTQFIQQQKYNTQKQFQRDDVAENLKFHSFSIRNQREKEILRTKYKTIMAEKKKKLKEDILYVTNQGVKDISLQIRAEDLIKK